MAGWSTGDNGFPLNSRQLARPQKLGWEWAVDEVRGQPQWPIINSIPTATTSVGGMLCRHPHELSSALECSGKFTTAALAYLLKIKTTEWEGEAASEEECV